jgi:RNA polymerase sigma-70 factor (ECF subfamily)
MADDQALLKAVREGNREALAAVFDRFSSPLYKYALRLCSDPVEADDIVGDVFSHLLHQLKEGKGPRENLRAYLYQAAYHGVVDHARARGQSAILDDSLPSDPARVPASLQEGQDLLRALELSMQHDLTDEQRHVVVLRFFENFSLKETSEILGKSVGNIKAIQSRAVAILRRTVSEPFQDNR